MNISGINNIQANNIQSQLQKAGDDEFQKKLEAAMNSKDKEELKKVSQEIEAIFLNMMFSQMNSSILKSDLIEKAPGHEIWESMFNEKVADEASKGKGIGLAELIYQQISKNIENTYKLKDE